MDLGKQCGLHRSDCHFQELKTLAAILLFCCETMFAAGNITCTTLHIGTSPTTNLTDGLIAYYPFEEGTGTTTADTSGNGRNGTFFSGPTYPGSPVWTNGSKIGAYALYFNGVGGITVGDFADNPTNFTISAWVRHFASNLQGMIVTRVGVTGGAGAGWIYMDENGEARFAVGTATEWTETSGAHPYSLISDGAWHHFVACKRGTNVWSYLDAVLVYPGSDVEGVPPGAYYGPGMTPDGNSSVSGAVYIGDNNTDPILKGVVDDLRIYNRTLSSNEVNYLYSWRP